MAARVERESYDGLAQVAHAIRRSSALYVAAFILPPGSSIEDLKDQAEDLAKWIGGAALVHDAEQQAAPKPTPLGEQWPPVEE